MSTSLAAQLQKLATPQTKAYKDDKKRDSLLFTPKEAALKDKQTFYEIGISGLKELSALYEGFKVYEDTLFSLGSKDFERAMETKDINENLNHNIENFLKQLSPYLSLQSSLKALEWLVHRYRIHEYNQDAIMALILPYHETKIFVRFIQLMDIKPPSNRWNWLEPIQKSGVALTRQVLYNQCCSNPTTLYFVAKNVEKYVKFYGERSSQLKTVFAFFTATSIGTLDNSTKVTESLVNAMLPTLGKGISSPVPDFRAAAYIVIGFMSAKTKLKEKTLNEILYKLFSSTHDLTYDVVLLMNLIYSTQPHLKGISEVILFDMTVDRMSFLCVHLKKLIGEKVSCYQFVLKFLTSILALIQMGNEEFHRFKELPTFLIEEVDFKAQHPDKIIKCVLDAFQPNNSERIESDGSDIEIIDDDNNYHPTSTVVHWYTHMLKGLEKKYPEDFDKVIREVIGTESELSKSRRAELTKILGFKPAIVHKIGDTSLFEKLNHVNPDMRVEAVKYITDQFLALKLSSVEFLRESVISRLSDDNLEVVKTVLEIPMNNLNDVLHEEDLKDLLVIILRKAHNNKKWRSIVNNAIYKFCSSEKLPITQETVLAIFPYLFPNNGVGAQITSKIINSNWGKRFELTKDLKVVNDNHEEICTAVFNALCFDRNLGFDNVLDFLSLNKHNTLDICIYLLLKSCTLERASIEDNINYIDTLRDSANGRQIILTDNNNFSSASISEFIQLAKEDKLSFTLLEYLLNKLIEDVKINDINLPWCNLYGSSETIFIKKLFEICITGCYIKNYNLPYLKLLHKLLTTLFSSVKEQMEFMTNFASGHTLYALKREDVIGPEFQIKTLKFLLEYICASECPEWITKSEAFITMILFNLNHPLSKIREGTIQVIKKILQFMTQSNIYGELLKLLIEHEDELILDNEQILQVLNTILLQHNPNKKVFQKNLLKELISMITVAPPHVSSELLKLMSTVNTAGVFSLLMPVINNLITKLKLEEHNPKFSFDVYESKLFKNILLRINTHTVSNLKNDECWNIIVFALKVYKEVILDEGTHISPCMLILKQFDEETFRKIPENRVVEIVKLICVAGTFSNNSSISSVASRTIKKVHLHFNDFKLILQTMLEVSDPGETTHKKKKVSVTMLSYKVAETDDWKIGDTLLGYISRKKKMTVDNSFMSILFNLLKKCLYFEEQVYVEYTKQLILSSMQYYCTNFVDKNDTNRVNSLKSLFDISLIVQCIRGTQDPQTHRDALMLLSHAAYMLPEQVLHHILEIFTFMGSSVLRHDDAYSFLIIAKTVETLIPILVKLDRDIHEYDHLQLQQLQSRVVPVLRVFADVVLGVPEHRRLPLYKKLIETLDAKHFFWVFLALLLETHIVNNNVSIETTPKHRRSLADREAPFNRLDFGQSIVLEFPAEVIIENFVKLLIYVKSLPIQKDDDTMDTDIDPGEIFSVSGHTAHQLRHYRYIVITFMKTCMESAQFIQHMETATDLRTLEAHYKNLIVNILTFLQVLPRINDERFKYWRVIESHTLNLLDDAVNLLSISMFLSVIKGLMNHNIHSVRRKSMEMLNNKIQHNPEAFKDCDKKPLFSLLPILLEVVEAGFKDNEDENLAKELQTQQQIALFSLKLMTRMLAAENTEVFQPVLKCITEYVCNPELSGNVMASLVLCLAELCSALKTDALVYLQKFMPALLDILKKMRKINTPELILQAIVTALWKIIESLSSFLSPYLDKILYEYSLLCAKWESFDRELANVSLITGKLSTIKEKVSTSIPARVLIPSANETHNMLITKRKFKAIGPLMSVLAQCFAGIETGDLIPLQQSLTNFFLSALELRRVAVEKNLDAEVISNAEDEIINALASLALKFTESSFRQFYFKIYDWAVRSNVDAEKDKVITFYRLSYAVACNLKGMFLSFAGLFIKNAVELLDACNKIKTEELFFDSEEKCSMLVENILNTLSTMFLYDKQNFVNSERFETLMQPIVDQLENPLEGAEQLKSRATNVLIPCLSRFAVAAGDDSLWKLLNYQVLLKIRHNDSEISLIALDCLVKIASELGTSWLPLLAESVPYIAELLEDGDSKVETATKNAIRQLEHILGEPLEKYF